MSYVRTLLMGAVGLFALSLGATTVEYTAAGTVSEPFAAGVDRVDINMPAFTGANSFLEITADNTGWSGEVYLNRGALRISSIAALGSVSAIHCASGTCILVTAQFASPTLNAAIIDKISVNTCDGEPWVAFWVYGEGLKNNIDFTNQQYLWLSAPSKTKMGVSGWEDSGQTLVGTFTPHGNTYRFGYNFSNENNRMRGLIVANLCDIDAEHPRKIVIRKGSHVFPSGQVNTTTGGIVLEQGGYLGFNGTSWAEPPSLISDYLKIGSGCGIWVRTSNALSLSANAGVVFNGSVLMSVAGNNTSVANGFTIRGPVSGSGSILITDSGAIHFAGASNTYSGNIEWNWGLKNCWVEFGNGSNFSWPGTGTFTFAGGSEGKENILINSNVDGDFGMKISGAGHVFKRGTGTVTMLQPLSRSGATGEPMLEIEAGALKRGAVETAAASGWMLLNAGSAFDLGGLAQSNMYLPYGAGTVSNPVENAAIEVSNAAVENSKVFSGLVTAPLKLKNTSATIPWRLGDGATFEGGLEVQQGEVAVEAGATVNGAITYAGGTVSYGVGASVPDGVVVGNGISVAFGSSDANVASVSGAGLVTLASGGNWPDADFSEFTGRILPSAGTASADAGTLNLSGNDIFLTTAWSPASSSWMFLGNYCCKTNVNGKTELQLSSGHHTGQYSTSATTINSTLTVPVAKCAWRVSFDYNEMMPWGNNTTPYDASGFNPAGYNPNNSNIGDRFDFLIHAGAESRNYSDWYAANGYMPGAYGFTVDKSSGSGRLCWRTNGVVHTGVNCGTLVNGVVVSNRLFHFDSLKTKTVHVDISYDGSEKMILSWDIGTEKFVTTNANAGADLLDRYGADGKARLCFHYEGGGSFTALRISNLDINFTNEATPAFGGTLALHGGENVIAADGRAACTVSANLVVNGEASIVSKGVRLNFTSDNWTFDFGEAASPKAPKLTLPVAATLPATIALTLEGPVPHSWTQIADLSAVSGAGDISFTCADQSVKIRNESGLVSVKSPGGTILLIR